jgi:hypothetical protein
VKLTSKNLFYPWWEYATFFGLADQVGGGAEEIARGGREERAETGLSSAETF